jgi:hypothetical protein
VKEKETVTEIGEFAAAFVRDIVDGNADNAHGMLSAALARVTTATDLSGNFILLAEDMGGVNGIGEPMVILEEWPNMSADERAMVLVPLEGDVFSEAVTVTVASVDGGWRISNIEWGRP